ncbi:hypothetical protein B0T17DRAFT_601307 [Bombardia bombarda]|uniref:Uncharacterized protein n=1 Tax=Bombardia bombarda TaxID=252184 RepID=A0AA40BYQ3_9PEZI|nr:hypothetical protein B0T17DRAFT_601307 [Bombardia bombarda]
MEGRRCGLSCSVQSVVREGLRGVDQYENQRGHMAEWMYCVDVSYTVVDEQSRAEAAYEVADRRPCSSVSHFDVGMGMGWVVSFAAYVQAEIAKEAPSGAGAVYDCHPSHLATRATLAAWSDELRIHYYKPLNPLFEVSVESGSRRLDNTTRRARREELKSVHNRGHVEDRWHDLTLPHLLPSSRTAEPTGRQLGRAGRSNPGRCIPTKHNPEGTTHTDSQYGQQSTESDTRECRDLQETSPILYKSDECDLALLEGYIQPAGTVIITTITPWTAFATQPGFQVCSMHTHAAENTQIPRKLAAQSPKMPRKRKAPSQTNSPCSPQLQIKFKAMEANCYSRSNLPPRRLVSEADMQDIHKGILTLLQCYTPPVLVLAPGRMRSYTTGIPPCCSYQ